MNERTHLTGRCMCGAVHFEVTAPLLGALACHCKRCQRRAGTAPSRTALTEPGSFALTGGEEAVRDYDPTDGWIKSFCSVCGSHLFTTHPENPELIAIRFGALDQDPGVRPSVHQFVDYAPPWAPVPDDGLPRFSERMSWDDDPSG
jgi:hypothetical protein